MIFDTYVFVDWSASKVPKLGKDSIWICRLRRTPSGAENQRAWNIGTRHAALEELLDILAHEVIADRRVLIGFDICYGFPAGTARLLRLKGKPWRKVWDLLEDRLVEGPNNANNRFDVAAGLNQQMSGRALPFWACPPGKEQRFLKQRRQHRAKDWALAEFREVDRRLKSAHSVWKLYTTGAVGGQTLTGIPVLKAIRNDRSLASRSKIWPFETGFLSPADLADRWNIIHAETYLSLIPVKFGTGQIKDEEQVKAHARYFARLDRDGTLGKLFETPQGLSATTLRSVLTEEGWTLGVA